MLAIKTILHPTDFSESSKHAMTYAIAFAEEFQAKLVLLHVIEEISSALYFDMLQAPPLTQLMVNIEKRARAGARRNPPPRAPRKTAGRIYHPQGRAVRRDPPLRRARSRPT